MLHDTIADLLTRIRNAQLAKQRYVEVRHSKENTSIIKVLIENNFLQKMHLFPERNLIRILLKYDAYQKPVISEIKRVSKPGRRIYTNVDAIPVVKKGLGLCVISTSKGVMCGLTARKERVGGEVLCCVC